MVLKLDITDKVLVGGSLEGIEMIPLERCVCGLEFPDWAFPLWLGHSDSGDKATCPNCGRKMWFEVTIKVFQELREEDRLCNQPLAPYNKPISPELFTLLSGGFQEFACDKEPLPPRPEPLTGRIER